MAQLPQNYEAWQNRNEPQKNDYPNWENMSDEELFDLVEDREAFNLLSLTDREAVNTILDGLRGELNVK